MPIRRIPSMQTLLAVLALTFFLFPLHASADICCYVNGTCQLFSSNCLASQGIPVIGPTTCGGSPCLWSCCNPTGGTCTRTSLDSCQAPSMLVGNWGGVCQPNPCPPAGMCCSLTTGLCTFVIQTSCTGQSTWTLGGTCTPNPCPPSGACCTGGLGGACAVNIAANCSGQWLSGATCSPNICPQANDRCSQALNITTGMTPFSTVNATTDGLSHPGCDFAAYQGIAKDVWYTFASVNNAALTVSTCGATFDTKIAVYSNTSCPGTDATLLACNDDNSNCGPNSVQSQLTLNINALQTYLIRVGGYDFAPPDGGDSGTGVLSLTLVTTGACCNRWNGTCLVESQALCLAHGLRFDGFGSTCSATTCKNCPADFNGTGGVQVADIFAFLSAWFAGCP